MAAYFFDSSAIAKHYVSEHGSTWIGQVLDPSAQNRIYLARISGVEVVAAIAKRVRSGSMAPEAGAGATKQFRADFDKLPRIVEISAPLVHRAMDLAERHALRGYDATQFAAALIVAARYRARGLSTTLVSADDELNAAATVEGLQVENPNLYP